MCGKVDDDDEEEREEGQVEGEVEGMLEVELFTRCRKSSRKLNYPRVSGVCGKCPDDPSDSLNSNQRVPSARDLQ